jgi:hypothetical protein
MTRLGAIFLFMALAMSIIYGAYMQFNKVKDSSLPEFIPSNPPDRFPANACNCP